MAKILHVGPKPVFCIKDIELPFAIAPAPKAKRGRSVASVPPDNRYLVSVGRIAEVFSDALKEHLKLISANLQASWPKDRSYGIDVLVFVRKSGDGDVNSLATTVIEAGRGILWTHENQIAKLHVHKMIVQGGKPRAFINLCVYDKTGLERRKG